MRNLFLVVCGALLLSAQAAPNPVIAHYRAYSAALQAGDLTTAETEADAALQASVARDGNGGRTGVLALNLAKLRIVRGNAEGAYDPAKQAFDIASAGPNAGVDSLQARLVLGQAELTATHQQQARDLLMPALSEAATRPELGEDAYQAAVALGNWLMMGLPRANYEDTAAAWAFAAQYARSLGADYAIPLAQARINQGIALINLAAENHDRHSDYEHAMTVLDEPLRLLGEMANTAPDEDELTIAQVEYGRARAWQAVINARLQMLGHLTVAHDEPAPDWYEDCQITMHHPQFQYPRGELSEGHIGVVVVRFVLRNGDAQGVKVAAAAPPASFFEQEVRQSASEWTAHLQDDAPDCLQTRVAWRTVVFRFD